MFESISSSKAACFSRLKLGNVKWPMKCDPWRRGHFIIKHALDCWATTITTKKVQHLKIGKDSTTQTLGIEITAQGKVVRFVRSKV